MSKADTKTTTDSAIPTFVKVAAAIVGVVIAFKIGGAFFGFLVAVAAGMIFSELIGTGISKVTSKAPGAVKFLGMLAVSLWVAVGPALGWLDTLPFLPFVGFFDTALGSGWFYAGMLAPLAVRVAEKVGIKVPS